jgi:hypothetical protein
MVKGTPSQSMIGEQKRQCDAEVTRESCHGLPLVPIYLYDGRLCVEDSSVCRCVMVELSN